jgi:hypothetical protein
MTEDGGVADAGPRGHVLGRRRRAVLVEHLGRGFEDARAVAQGIGARAHLDNRSRDFV